MVKYEPVDDRAMVTLGGLLAAYNHRLNQAQNYRTVNSVVINSFPPAMASSVTNLLGMTRVDQIEPLRTAASREARNYLARLIGQTKPFLTDVDGSIVNEIEEFPGFPGDQIYFFSREDVVTWYYADSLWSRYFPPPTEEFFSIVLNSESAGPPVYDVKLKEANLVGIAYGIQALLAQGLSVPVTVQSSLTEKELQTERLVKYSLDYQVPSPFEVASSIEVLLSNEATKVYFQGIDFLSGLLTVARWANLAKDGEGVLWQQLSLKETQ